VKVGIVTDSMSDIPYDIAKQYNIKIVPGIIHANGHYYRSGVDFFQEDIEKSIENDISIKTGAPPPVEYYNVYTSLLEKFDTIISIHCPAEHSGVLNSAKAAARKLENPSCIHHFECGVATLGLGLTSIAAAIIAETAKNLYELYTQVEKLCSKIQVIGTIDSFKYVKKSGRLKLKIAGLFANALSIKPVLIMQNAKISLLARPRNRESAINIMINEVVTKVDQELDPQIIGIGHFKCNNVSQDVEYRIKESLPNHKIIRTNVDPMIAAYTGPGLILLAFFNS
jgi:DegV family protein with EDD domain